MSKKTKLNKRTLRKAWIESNFDDELNFLEKTFALRNENPQKIIDILHLPSLLWGKRDIRRLRRKSVRHMMRSERKKNTNVEYEELCDKWHLDAIPGFIRYTYTQTIHGYNELFESAGKGIDR